MTIEDDLAALFPHPILLNKPALEAYAAMRSAEARWLSLAEAAGHSVHHLEAQTPSADPDVEQRFRRQTVVIDTGVDLPPLDELVRTRRAFQTAIDLLQPRYRAGERSTALPAWSTPEGLVPVTQGRPDVPLAAGVTYRTKTAWRGRILSLDGCIAYLEKRLKTLQQHASNYRKQYKSRQAVKIEARAAAIVDAIDSLRQLPADGSISGRVRSGQAILFRVHVIGWPDSRTWESTTPHVLLVRGKPTTTFLESTKTRRVENTRTLVTTIENIEIFTQAQ